MPQHEAGLQLRVSLHRCNAYPAHVEPHHLELGLEQRALLGRRRRRVQRNRPLQHSKLLEAGDLPAAQLGGATEDGRGGVTRRGEGGGGHHGFGHGEYDVDVLAVTLGNGGGDVDATDATLEHEVRLDNERRNDARHDAPEHLEVTQLDDVIHIRHKAQNLLGPESLLLNARMKLALFEEKELLEPHGERARLVQMCLGRDVALELTRHDDPILAYIHIKVFNHLQQHQLIAPLNLLNPPVGVNPPPLLNRLSKFPLTLHLLPLPHALVVDNALDHIPIACLLQLLEIVGTACCKAKPLLLHLLKLLQSRAAHLLAKRSVGYDWVIGGRQDGVLVNLLLETNTSNGTQVTQMRRRPRRRHNVPIPEVLGGVVDGGGLDGRCSASPDRRVLRRYHRLVGGGSKPFGSDYALLVVRSDALARVQRLSEGPQCLRHLGRVTVSRPPAV
mmetsp:Transcript_24376/g.47303  ORF Transcript_24376/g.47303 Transcript_24376/m.47303 type:complete len:445 (+) Transcript_24376:618-1952(+)